MGGGATALKGAVVSHTHRGGGVGAGVASGTEDCPAAADRAPPSPAHPSRSGALQKRASWFPPALRSRLQACPLCLRPWAWRAEPGGDSGWAKGARGAGRWWAERM